MTQFRYAGIGSRQTPADVLGLMRLLGYLLAKRGWVLRSGGADGADSAFEAGCDEAGGAKEIYLPWKGFNGNKSPLFLPPERAFKLAEECHPAWGKLSQGARKLQARNSQQVLGTSLDWPAQCIICWTPDGVKSGEHCSAATGGTGQAIRLASREGIRVWNLGNADDLKVACEWAAMEGVGGGKT